MKTISIDFSNMWGLDSSFDVPYFLSCFPYLRDHYQFVIKRDNPDLMFYSVYDYVRKLAPNSIRLVYSGEPGDHFAQGGKMAPGHNAPGFYHYGLTCAVENMHPNHLYYPQPALMLALHNGSGLSALVRKEGWVAPEKDTFCNFIYSNPNSHKRIDFFRALSGYKHVEALGTCERNNQALAHAAYSTEGYRAKQAYQARCRFSIAMESSYFKGYHSEKVSDAMLSGSVALYSGDPQIGEVFNPESFVNLDSFASDEEAVDFIRAIDSNEQIYNSYLYAPPFRGNIVPEQLTDDFFLNFWYRVLGDI